MFNKFTPDSLVHSFCFFGSQVRTYKTPNMVLFEVEQKFNWTSEKLHKLRKVLNNPIHHPTFKAPNLEYHAFHDTYYDSHQTLSKHGLWVRKRLSLPGPCKWEAKRSRKPAVDFLRTTFEETNDTSQILKMLKAYIPTASDHSQNFGLEEMCQFTTWRNSFEVNEKFNVVLDETDFGHRVGEIEVMAEDPDVAHKEIENFKGKHGWLFGGDGGEKPKGKVTAWFERFGEGGGGDGGGGEGEGDKVRGGRPWLF